jgi:hypothetical protein
VQDQIRVAREQMEVEFQQLSIQRSQAQAFGSNPPQLFQPLRFENIGEPTRSAQSQANSQSVI